jgi:hypothetical protein
MNYALLIPSFQFHLLCIIFFASHFFRFEGVASNPQKGAQFDGYVKLWDGGPQSMESYTYGHVTPNQQTQMPKKMSTQITNLFETKTR